MRIRSFLGLFGNSNDTRQHDRHAVNEKSAAVAVKRLSSLLGEAENEIVVVAGKLNSSIYGEASVIAALESAVSRGVSLSIAVGPEPDRIALGSLESVRASVLVLENYPEMHFSVIDGKHVRIEAKHFDRDAIPDNTVERFRPLTALWLLRKFATYVSMGASAYAQWTTEGNAS